MKSASFGARKEGAVAVIYPWILEKNGGNGNGME
jgi:hypothetical protein